MRDKVLFIEVTETMLTNIQSINCDNRGGLNKSVSSKYYKSECSISTKVDNCSESKKTYKSKWIK